MAENQPTPAEEWRPVPGSEGVYLVSNLGRVKVLPRFSTSGRKLKGKIISQSTTKGGYKRAFVIKDGVRAKHMVHRLVLEAFIGPRQDGMEGCHNNGDPSDNRLENLRWDTKYSNEHDKKVHGTSLSERRMTCKRGHPFIDANIRVSNDMDKGRTCLSCSMAYNSLHRKKEEEDFEMQIQHYSDHLFVGLVSGSVRQKFKK